MIEEHNFQNSAILNLRAIECFFRALLTLIPYELWRHLSGNVGLSRTAVKFYLWWPVVTSFLTLAKKWPKYFRETFSQAFECRLPLRATSLSFRDLWGRARSSAPPHPSVLSWPRPPSVRGLTSREKHCRAASWLACPTRSWSSFMGAEVKSPIILLFFRFFFLKFIW